MGYDINDGWCSSMVFESSEGVLRAKIIKENPSGILEMVRWSTKSKSKNPRMTRFELTKAELASSGWKCIYTESPGR